jgi:hypothetical protein
LALSWVSVSARRVADAVGSAEDAVMGDAGGLEGFLDAASSFGSTLSVALALDTCTAGDSPKKLGRV